MGVYDRPAAASDASEEQVERANEAGFATLRRTGIESLDEALYAASCFTGASEDGTVTIMMAVNAHTNDELYWITDGRREEMIRDTKAGLNWRPVYHIEKA